MAKSQCVNLLAPGRSELEFCNFEAIFIDTWLWYLLWNLLQWMPTAPYWWSVNIVSDNGLVPSGNKPLPESVLTHIYVAI